jgi:hypothetical protein
VHAKVAMTTAYRWAIDIDSSIDVWRQQGP